MERFFQELRRRPVFANAGNSQQDLQFLKELENALVEAMEEYFQDREKIAS